MPSRPRKRAKPPKLYQFPYVRFHGKFYPLNNNSTNPLAIEYVA